MAKLNRVCWSLCLLLPWMGIVQAQESVAPLPKVLTLKAAYAQVQSIPEVLRLESQFEQIKADQALRDSEIGWRARLDAELARREFRDQVEDNNSLYLSLNKPLYRFGKDAANSLMTQAENQWMEAQQAWALQAYRLRILRDYFSVIEADLQERVAVEELAIAFVTYDKYVERHKLGQISDAELAEQESLYQPYSTRYAKVQQLQHFSRENLALTLGRPGELSSQVETPDYLAYLERIEKLPETPKAWIEKAQTSHPALVVLNQQIQVKQAALQRNEKSLSPDLGLSAKVGDQSHREDREGRWKLGIQLSIPLYDGGTQSGLSAKLRAEIQGLETEKTLLKREIYRQVFALWHQLSGLKADLKAESVLVNFTDLNMMRNRARYEQEWAADLGDAMVQMSKTALAQGQTRLRIAQAYEELDLLQGVGQ
jgi:outer membrane protein TolC